jgi:hypothetical protein
MINKFFCSKKPVKASDFAFELCSIDSRFLFYDPFEGPINDGSHAFYIPTKENIFIPAGKVVVPVEHQLAHIIEMNNLERIIQDDYGLDNFGSLKPRTLSARYAALARELRVRAIEKIIKEDHEYSHERIIERLIDNQSFSVNGWDNDLPFGKFKTKKDVEIWALDIFSKTISHWDRDKIQYEWIQKVNYIKHWMELRQK